MFAARRPDETVKAELTKNMIEAILESFDSLATPNGTVTVQFRDNALYVANGSGPSEFVGLATLPAALDYIK